MKIIGIITHNDAGGAQKAMAKLQTHILSEDVDMEIVYLYGVKGNETMNNGVILVDSEKGKINRYALSFIRLCSYIKTEQPDTVISFLPYSNVVSSFIARYYGVKERIISHRNPVWTYHFVLRFLDKILGSLGFYTAIVSNSLAVSDSIDKYPPPYKNLRHIIYNGVEKPSIEESHSSIKARFGLPAEKPIIVAVGRLNSQKRFDLALNIIANIETCHFVIAGHGELRHELIEQANKLGIRNRVHFLGLLNNKNVLSLLKISDVYLQTSSFEGQSNALLEAISVGCVVISSDIKPQREVLVSNDGSYAGILIESNDPSEWSTKINELFSDSGLRNQFSDKAITRSLDFTLDKMAESFLKLSKSE